MRGKLLSALVIVLFISSLSIAQTTCDDGTSGTLWVSENGSGNGSSDATPDTLGDIWSSAGPGDVIVMLTSGTSASKDTWTGSANMIQPPNGLNGTSSSPIRVCGEVAGAIVLDGENTREPVLLTGNDYFILEDFDATNGNTNVVHVYGNSDHNIFRRMVASDADPTGNSVIWRFGDSAFNLIEDTAGFGSSRKVYSFGSQNANNNVLRRCWGMWTFNTLTFPKQTFSLAYNSYNNIGENCIGTLDADAGAETTDLRTIISENQMFESVEYSLACSRSKWLGSIGYMDAGANDLITIGIIDNFRAQACITYENNIAVSDQNTPLLSLRKASEYDSVNPTHPWEGVYRNNTVIGTGSSSIQSAGDWVLVDNVDVDTLDEAPNPFNGAGTMGARICFRYQNGSLTTIPLWPWPMDQRIIDALSYKGEVTAGVEDTLGITAQVEHHLGAIPDECRSDVGGGSPELASISLSFDSATQSQQAAIAIETISGAAVIETSDHAAGNGTPITSLTLPSFAVTAMSDMVCACGVRDGSAGGFTSIGQSSNALTLVAEASVATKKAQLWCKENPTTATEDLVGTFTSEDNVSLGAVSIRNVQSVIASGATTLNAELTNTVTLPVTKTDDALLGCLRIQAATDPGVHVSSGTLISEDAHGGGTAIDGVFHVDDAILLTTPPPPSPADLTNTTLIAPHPAGDILDVSWDLQGATGGEVLIWTGPHGCNGAMRVVAREVYTATSKGITLDKTATTNLAVRVSHPEAGADSCVDGIVVKGAYL